MYRHKLYRHPWLLPHPYPTHPWLWQLYFQIDPECWGFSITILSFQTTSSRAWILTSASTLVALSPTACSPPSSQSDLGNMSISSRLLRAYWLPVTLRIKTQSQPSPWLLAPLLPHHPHPTLASSLVLQHVSHPPAHGPDSCFSLHQEGFSPRWKSRLHCVQFSAQMTSDQEGLPSTHYPKQQTPSHSLSLPAPCTAWHSVSLFGLSLPTKKTSTTRAETLLFCSLLSCQHRAQYKVHNAGWTYICWINECGLTFDICLQTNSGLGILVTTPILQIRKLRTENRRDLPPWSLRWW